MCRRRSGWRIQTLVRAEASRNVLIHNYMGVNAARVWGDVADKLPGLKEHVAVVLAASAPLEDVQS